MLKLNDDTRNNDESDKCVKLSKAISTKAKEVSEIKVENKNLREKNTVLTKQLNEVSSKATALEIKNTRLENQVENLIEAIGKKNETRKEPEEQNVPPKSPPSGAVPVQRSVKCRHNDKAICLRKDSCQFIHYKLLCDEYSKSGKCDQEETCQRRHPSPLEKRSLCFYRHPSGEEGSESRKRSLSGHQELQASKTQKTTEDTQNRQMEAFLLKKMMDLEQKVQSTEVKKPEKKEENLPTGWINPRWSAVPPFQPSSQGASFHTPVPPFQAQYSTGTPSGGQWVQHPPQQVVFHQVPGANPYQL